MLEILSVSLYRFLREDRYTETCFLASSKPENALNAKDLGVVPTSKCYILTEVMRENSRNMHFEL